uniref:Uncharacterized protein n=1 Tax=Anguilla anguilla TaxID=7936 RepID=A0A0E9S271_ANGAN
MVSLCHNNLSFAGLTTCCVIFMITFIHVGIVNKFINHAVDWCSCTAVN